MLTNMSFTLMTLRLVSAEEVSEMMKKTYPFSKFNIEVEIVRVRPDELECSSKHGIDRLVSCDNLDQIQRKAMKLGGDRHDY